MTNTTHLVEADPGAELLKRVVSLQIPVSAQSESTSSAPVVVTKNTEHFVLTLAISPGDQKG